MIDVEPRVRKRGSRPGRRVMAASARGEAKPRARNQGRRDVIRHLAAERLRAVPLRHVAAGASGWGNGGTRVAEVARRSDVRAGQREAG